MMYVINYREFYEWLDNPTTLAAIPAAWRQDLRKKLINIYQNEYSRPLLESAILEGYKFQELPRESEHGATCDGTRLCF